MKCTFDRRFTSALACALAAAALASPWTVAQTPPDSSSQTPPADARTVRTVDKFAHMAAFLNLAQGTVRIVVIAPTDKRASLFAVDSVTAMVRSIPSKRLRAYLIMRGTGTRLQAAVLAGRAADPRFACFWDSTGTVASAWEAGATVGSGVWLYDTSAKFTDAPPPAVTAVTAPFRTPLAASNIRARTDELVRRVEAKVARSGSGLE
jgi:hypothetical protein